MGSPFDREPVRDSAELKRIITLPRRDWQTGYHHPIDDLRAELTLQLRRPGSEMILRGVQAAALAEAYYTGGLFAPIGVGEGKTLPSFLLARVMRKSRPLLLVPANLREKTERDYRALQLEWVLPDLRIENYELLSREQASQFLANFAPDIIIADEAHKLKSTDSAITRRVARYLRESSHAGNRPAVCLLSGTFTRRSIMDYWHLLRWCLGDDAAPVPKDWAEAYAWADALGVLANEDAPRTPPGALVKLCNSEETAAVAAGSLDTVGALRSAYRRRLTETPGVVSTIEQAVDASIVLKCTALDLPALNDHFYQLRKRWETPGNEPFETPVELWRHTLELTCGFYYVWDPAPPVPWLEARRQWSKFVREVLKHSRKLDTEYQVRLAVAGGALPAGAAILAEWQVQEPTFIPNQTSVWMDSATLNYCAKWLQKNVGICWVAHRAFGQRLSQLTGLRYYGEGGLSEDGAFIEDERKPCIASIAANCEGKNLQHFHRNLLASSPSSGKTWEQLIGRMHRPGQLADTVYYEVLTSCAEQLNGLYRALEESEYVFQERGQQQKLCLADIMWPTGHDATNWLWRKPPSDE